MQGLGLPFYRAQAFLSSPGLSIEPRPCFSTGFDYKARFRATWRECCLVGPLARSDDMLFSFQNRWRDPPFRPRRPIA
jgi:hypothetical protein